MMFSNFLISSFLITFIANFTARPSKAPRTCSTSFKSLIDTFKFGNTQEFLEALDRPMPEQPQATNTDDIKVAILEVLRDVGLVPGSQQVQGGGMPQGGM